MSGNVAVDTLTGKAYTAHQAPLTGQLLNVAIPYNVIASQLLNPWGVTVDHYSNIYVAVGGRVLKYPGGTSVTGTPGGYDDPQIIFGISVDCSGAVYVADHAVHRIQVWPNSSVGITIIGKFNVPGNGSDRLTAPVDVKLDRQGNIYVLDRSHSHLHHPLNK
ncbi:unnamed protein product [Didymodactylos carnosus]|uniref:NHL repeat containing protein n=1 Tax=Didymodactylos carnosus TaxID=1234261 RepID=A0A815TXU4_9BILA|nr:unnamed protein product [Didymodactylos carnosus]CAF4370873.1 unnamed protein product [Didymodactylos carnosus]